MSSPFPANDSGLMAAPQGIDEGDASDSDIPKRMMRVKVLYTFDDDNKTNCLARLPNALPIPVVAIDETTEIGIMELKICIQAIVASSPELIAKLEHDYTVYAYDYSEYETPLVGQGMLSWVLASASPTPSAPASQSQTMITGRVCKNILGLFSSNGIKETLEVKLKLVPVPTRSKNEFLQNMAVYRNSNVVIPDGFDNNAWNSFLQAIPNTGAINVDGTQTNPGQPGAGSQGQSNTRSGMGGVEQLHDMLTPKFVQDDDGYSVAHHSSRAGSPANSHHSFSAHQPAAYTDSRPASRMSGQQQQQQQNEYALDDQNFEDGPARKRARLQQADWHGRGSFGSTADSLRVAVSTSASLRGFRTGSVAGNSSASHDMVPRAPTPRAAEKRGGRPFGPARMSSLRRESSSASYSASYGTADQNMSRTDSGIYSLDDDGGSIRNGSPSPDIPSSPPEYTPIEGSLPPSSPGLPELPYPTDSGFQSDFFTEIPTDQPPYKRNQGPNFVPPLNKHQQRRRDGVLEFIQVHPGPDHALPTVSFPQFDPLSQRAARSGGSRAYENANCPSSPTIQTAHQRGGRAKSRNTAPPSRQHSMTPFQPDATSPNFTDPMPSIENKEDNTPPNDNTNGSNDMQPPNIPVSAPPGSAQASSIIGSVPGPHGWAPQPLPRPVTEIPEEPQQGPMSAMTALPKRNPKSKQGQWSRPGQQGPKRSMSRSQSWAAGSSDVESDGPAGEPGLKSSRSQNGSGVVRTKAIDKHLQDAVLNGAPVRYCRNCGEIKTPTWRPYWVRAYEGDGAEFEVSTKVGIHFLESLTRDGDGKTTTFRVYKQYSHLTQEEKKSGIYEQFVFCNPCGDYIRKYAMLRPEDCWDPAKKVAKRQRRPRKPKQPGQFTSDAIAPSSDWDPHPSTTRPRFSDMPNFTDPFLPSEGPTHSMAPTPNVHRPTPGIIRPPPTPPLNQQGNGSARVQLDGWDGTVLDAALHKAIQSSPARLLGSQTSPIEIGDEHSPNPTRRLLFPSPRKSGEFKSLEHAPDADNTVSTTPTKAQKNSAKDTVALLAPIQQNGDAVEQVDKENLPPIEEEDDFAHLFDDTLLNGTPPPVTPNTARTIAAMFKTPTPAKSKTPRTGSKRSRTSALLATPTPTRTRSGRISKSPRFLGGQSPGMSKLLQQQQMTPISASLNQLLSEAVRSSPGKGIWGMASSPGKLFGGHIDSALGLGDHGLLHSEFPMPSSPPQLFSGNLHGMGGLGDGLDGFGGEIHLEMPGFEMWEDGTATDPVKGWEDFLASDAAFGAELSGDAVGQCSAEKEGGQEKAVEIGGEKEKAKA